MIHLCVLAFLFFSFFFFLRKLGLLSVINFGKNQTIISSNFILSYPSSSGIVIMCTAESLTLSNILGCFVRFLFFFCSFFPLCGEVWIISIYLSLSSLILSLAVLSLLISLFWKYFILSYFI